MPRTRSMILACPVCGTRYRVEERDLGGGPAGVGRIVRCANCGHSWHQVPASEGETALGSEQARSESALETASGAPEAPRLEGSPRLSPPPPIHRDRRRSGGLVWVGPIVLVLLLGLAVLAGTVGRDQVVATWPSAARLYAWIGHPVEPSGLGLVIGKIVPARTADGLAISGEIVNLGNAARDVPRLRLALQDAAGKEVQFEIVDPPKARLSAGEVAHFAIAFPNPVDAAAVVVATFVSP